MSIFKEVPKPTDAEVKRALAALKINNEQYNLQEEILEEVFTELKTNTNLKEVYIKATLLNQYYSTNIYDVYRMAKHITNIPDVDERIKNGDPKVVEEIANVKLKNEKQIKFYSFATKYCSFSNRLSYGTGRDDYPIYDRFVVKMLKHFRNKNKKSFTFKNTDLDNYEEFKKIVENFIKFFGLSGFTFKQIDKYLWSEGKEYFK